jgi:hypothetical protein
MATIRTSGKGIDYLHKILKQKPNTVTKAVFWKIPHNTQDKIDVRLKIARYKYIKVEGIDFNIEDLESKEPKSQIILDMEEFLELLSFIGENYEPFKLGVKRYLPIDDGVDGEAIEFVKSFFNNPDHQKVVEYISKNSLLTEQQISNLEYLKRVNAVSEFETMLESDLTEHDWQPWFKNNSWVLGSEFVKILDEREIDTENIADYLMEAYDDFLDVVEIKRPGGGLNFWAEQKDHNNYIISQDLTKAITQANKYLYEVEREADSQKFRDRVGVKTIKPRCTLLYGRSLDWNEEQREAYRILNSSYHCLTILTYDHVLKRAKRILGLEVDILEGSVSPEDIPF